MSVRPSDRHISARHTHDGIRELSHLGILQKSVGKLTNLVKIREKYRAFYVKISVLLYCSEQYEMFCISTSVRLHGNIQRLYITENYMYVNNTKGTHCCLSMTKISSAKAHQCYVIRTLPVLFVFYLTILSVAKIIQRW
jgi:hypothetical protein